MKSVVISQPRYLPVISYIQRLYTADLFVFLDDVQRSRDFENRNKVLINSKPAWLTIPLASPSRGLIRDAKMIDSRWVEKHKKTITRAYSKHPYFDIGIVDSLYDNLPDDISRLDFKFSDITIDWLSGLCGLFDFDLNFVRSSSLNIGSNGPQKIVDICKKVEATIYVCGVCGRDYGIDEAFKDTEIEVFYHEVSSTSYPQYKTDEFMPWMCFFDVLFNKGMIETEKIIKKVFVNKQGDNNGKLV